MLACLFVWQQRLAGARHPLGPAWEPLEGASTADDQSTRRMLVSNGQEAPQGRWATMAAAPPPRSECTAQISLQVALRVRPWESRPHRANGVLRGAGLRRQPGPSAGHAHG